MLNKNKLIEVFSNCINKQDGTPLSQNDFHDAFRDGLKVCYPSLNLEGLFLLFFSRFPYKDEVDDFNSKSFDIYSYAFYVLSSPKFILNIHRFFRSVLDYKLIYYIHVPKTGGTSLVSNIEKYTSMPTWSLDYGYCAREIYEKLPSMFLSIKNAGALFLRSHYSLRDINHVLDLTDGDSLVLTYRNPKGLHISNVNYITSEIDDAVNKAGGFQNLLANPMAFGIGQDWLTMITSFFTPSDLWVPGDVARRLLFSDAYKNTYSNILENTINPDILDIQYWVQNGMCKLARIDEVDNMIKSFFLISNPSRFNETKHKYLDEKNLLDNELKYLENYLCFNDLVLFEALERINGGINAD
jgi:hypothetical protein